MILILCIYLLHYVVSCVKEKYFYRKVDYIIYFFFLRVLEILLVLYIHISVLILNNFCIISMLLCFVYILCEQQ